MAVNALLSGLVDSKCLWRLKDDDSGGFHRLQSDMPPHHEHI